MMHARRIKPALPIQAQWLKISLAPWLKLKVFRITNHTNTTFIL